MSYNSLQACFINDCRVDLDSASSLNNSCSDYLRDTVRTPVTASLGRCFTLIASGVVRSVRTKQHKNCMSYCNVLEDSMPILLFSAHLTLLVRALTTAFLSVRPSIRQTHALTKRNNHLSIGLYQHHTIERYF